MPINTQETRTAILNVVSCALTLPTFGAWSARLELDTEDPADLIGPATLTLHPDDSTAPRSLVGTLFSGSIRNGRATARLYPGNGGMIQELPGKGYASLAARLIAADIANAAGEVIDPQSAGLDPILGVWARRQATAAQQISELCSFLGIPWKMTDAGQIRIGKPAATEYTPAPRVLFEDADTQTQEIDLPGVDLSPGNTLEGFTVDRVVYIFEQSARHTMIRYAA